jgi:hypothetical protein
MSRNSSHDLLNFTILQESDISTISADNTGFSFFSEKPSPSPSLVMRGIEKSIFAQIFNFLPG